MLRRFFRQTRMADVAVVHVEEDFSQFSDKMVFLGDLFGCPTALHIIFGITITSGSPSDRFWDHRI